MCVLVQVGLAGTVSMHANAPRLLRQPTEVSQRQSKPSKLNCITTNVASPMRSPFRTSAGLPPKSGNVHARACATNSSANGSGPTVAKERTVCCTHTIRAKLRAILYYAHSRRSLYGLPASSRARDGGRQGSADDFARRRPFTNISIRATPYRI